MTADEICAFARVEEQLIRDAVRAADRVILVGCAGNPEVLMLLTALVAEAFHQKVVLGLRMEVAGKAMLCEVDPKFLGLSAGD